MGKVRITDEHARDFWAYLRFRRSSLDRSFCPWVFAGVVPRGGGSALQAFVNYDARGKLIGCRHPRALKAALEGKKLLNFQIQQWSDDLISPILDGMPMALAFASWAGSLTELRESYPWLPEWVWVAVVRQARKRMKR